MHRSFLQPVGFPVTIRKLLHRKTHDPFVDGYPHVCSRIVVRIPSSIATLTPISIPVQLSLEIAMIMCSVLFRLSAHEACFFRIKGKNGEHVML